MKTSLFLQTIHDRLFSLYGECICPLHHDSPFQLLVAVMLSAQCRDERVNLVTEKLFALAPDAFSMSEMPVADVEKIIHPCGLSGSKSRNIVASATLICNKHQGRVPQNMDDLTALPGIGRKSANVILGNCFNIPGFPVDTHVRRVLNRLGVTRSQNPEIIEKEICSCVEDKLWTNFSHLIIRHGRKCCSAAKPKCENCVLAKICSKKGVGR